MRSLEKQAIFFRSPIRMGSLVVLLLAAFVLNGCMTTRGILYLNPTRSGAYLSKENKPTQKKPLVEKAVEEARKLLRTVPDGNRVLGGFCTDNKLARQISDIQDLAPLCRKKLKKYQNKSNLYKALDWGFFGATVASGLFLSIGGFAASPEAKGPIVVASGSMMLAFVLTTSIGPFARISSHQQSLSERLDNYMWTIRRRITNEVCNAPNRATAAYRLARIHNTIHTMCTATQPDTGLYKLPKQ